MFRARSALARFSTHFKARLFCSTIKDSKNIKKNNSNIVDGKIESNASTLNESYRQLDNLDFMTAAKILFTQPPKKKKFGMDFHLVQLFFACMPSLAVYLVAQYARYEMRKMEAELEEKKKLEEEAKRKQEEEEKEKEGEEVVTDPELIKVKLRLGKLEEALKEIADESKKQSSVNITKTQQTASEPGEDGSKSESSSSFMVQDKVTKQKSIKQIPNADPGKARSVSPASDSSQNQKDEKGEDRIGGPSQDAKR